MRSASRRTSWRRSRGVSPPRPSGRSAIEQEVFDELAGAVVKNAQAMASLAGALAELDVYASLAELAAVEAYVRPALDESTAFEIRGGRHPVVEQALQRAKSGPFVENDCILGRPELAPEADRFR